jgi:predicted site-specific integrase-resolvase
VKWEVVMPDVKGYSLKEVASNVGVVNATIVRWMETRKVKVKKKKNSRGYYFFTEADLQKFLEYKNRIITDDEK